MGRENEKSNITQMFRENKGHSLKTLLLLFRGRYLALFGSVFFFVIKHSPTWVLPIVTANIINAVTDKEGDIVRILTVNTILMLVFLVLLCEKNSKMQMLVNHRFIQFFARIIISCIKGICYTFGEFKGRGLRI